MTDKLNQNEDELILVDIDDRETGHGGKLAVHQQGLLHRAFSSLVSQRRFSGLLLQWLLSMWSTTICGCGSGPLLTMSSASP